MEVPSPNASIRTANNNKQTEASVDNASVSVVDSTVPTGEILRKTRHTAVRSCEQQPVSDAPQRRTVTRPPTWTCGTARPMTTVTATNLRHSAEVSVARATSCIPHRAVPPHLSTDRRVRPVSWKLSASRGTQAALVRPAGMVEETIAMDNGDTV